MQGRRAGGAERRARALRPGRALQKTGDAEKWLQQAADLHYGPAQGLLDALHQEQQAKAK